MPEPTDAWRARLAQIRQYEDSVKTGPLTLAAKRLGRTRGFAAIYSRIGPTIDPRLAPIADGRLMATVYGFPMLMLSTIGAKTGKPRTSPLLYVRDGDDVLLIGTNFGQPKHPGWTANLLAHPDAQIEIGPHQLRVSAIPIGNPEWDALFPSFVEVYPGYANYVERRGGLVPRMFRLVPQP